MKFPESFYSGMIFEVPLRNGYGFGFVKMIVAPIYFHQPILEQVQLRAYNVFSKKSLRSDFRADIFESDDLIFPPQLMIFKPTSRGEDKWTYLGDAAVTKEDQIVPDFRGRSDMENPEKFHKNYGYPVHRVWPSNSFFFVEDKSQVEYLSFWQHFHPIRFTYLLTTYWIEARKDNINNIILADDKNFHFVEDSKKLINEFKPFLHKKKDGRLRLIG